MAIESANARDLSAHESHHEALPQTITFTTSRISSLLTSPDLDQINDLVNAAYADLGHPDPAVGKLKGEMYANARVSYRTQLIDEIGLDSFLVICRDECTIHQPRTASTNDGTALENMSPERASVKDHSTFNSLQTSSVSKFPTARIVAVAALKPFKEKTVYTYKRRTGMMPLDLLPEELEYAKTDNWEVSTCATVNDAQYRGKGLVSQCVDLLIEEVKKQRRERGEKRPLKLWSTALCGSSNPEYWRKRGFSNEGGPDDAPVGVWSSKIDFQIQTLGKLVDG